ncbi:thioesterase II family protein [Mesorhizobium sp. ISC15]|uniref:thioesterase II family protein n=1 Tax=Mesorhizobium sp. ISC15 TaxID=3076429 RepID=UPI00301B8900
MIIPRPKPDAPIRLIGFPYAGGGPLVFQHWIDKMPDHIELGILQMPGRSARLEEGFWLRMEDMVDGIVPEMLPFLKDKPFAFFGFCYGGVQAFEIAHRVRRDHGLQPEYFFVAGGRSPQIYNDDQLAIDVQQFNHGTGKAEHELDESEFVEMLKEVNFANNKALFEDPEMHAMMLPIIQADYAMNNAYRYGSHPPLDAPITAIGGRVDPYVTGNHIIGWKEHTTKQFKAHFCAGDHFFMEHQIELLTRIAIEDLEPVVQRLAADGKRHSWR